MDLSELNSPPPTARSEPGGLPEVDCESADAAWRLAGQIGVEVASPLTQALDRVRELQSSGRIDRPGLHALVTEIGQARRASMVGQQIVRLAQGGTQQQHENVNLTQALRDLLMQRGDDLNARGIAIKQVLKPAEVIVDATLLSALLNTMLDWSLRHACSAVEMQLDVKPWPAHARLVCRFEHTPADQVAARSDVRSVATVGSQRTLSLECLAWQLMLQLARTMQLPVERSDSQGTTALTLEFPHTANDSLEGASSIELNSSFSLSSDSRPLAGSHVLVISLRRDVRNQIRQAVNHMGLVLDFVSTPDAAREFCQQGLPHAIVYESAVFDGTFDRLRDDVRQQCPELAWIEVTEQGEAFEISSFGGTSMARVGREAIASSLPSALMFELAKGQ
jgi:predicted DNA-binding ribbon-helix-helix protein